MAGQAPNAVGPESSPPRRLSNTRPRDTLGRPLPWDGVGEPMVPERDDITSAAAITEALDYLRTGRPFHAHEVLEQRWRCAPHDEREWWRALAQAAAGVTQAARGNQVGAQRLRERARATLEALATPPALTQSVSSSDLDSLKRSVI